MRVQIPEDLSQLPDASRRSGAPSAVEVEEVPEDLSALPDAEPSEEEILEAQVAGTGKRMKAGLLGLSVAGVLALLAALYAVIEVTDVVARGFAVHPALGWTTAALAGLLVGLVSWIIARELRGYLHLRVFVRLREGFEELKERPGDRELEREARGEIEGLLRYLAKAGEPSLLVDIQRVRERMDLAEDPLEWRQDLERVLLGPMDEQTEALIRREAVNVGLATAISPSGFIDAVIVAWRNFRLVKEIAGIYRVRAGAYGTYLILRRTVASIAVADLAHEASIALLGTTRSLTSFLGKPLTQGLANATMTTLVGLKAQDQCRPLVLPDERKRSIARMLVGSVRDGIKRLAPRGGRRDEQEED
jgi:putative membrane protein